MKAIARKLGLRHQDHDSQRLYFENLASQASLFSSHSAQVDYAHYQTYISNGYGHRCHDLQQYFGIKFPFLDTAFLQAVFALPQNEKEGFALVTRGIERLAPKLSVIPYTSANEKSLKPVVRKPVRGAMQRLIRLLGPGFYDWFLPPRRGRAKITTSEYEMLAVIRSNSHITDLLTRTAIQGIEKIPFIRMDYLIETCLYLHLLERELGVICTIEGSEV